MPEPITMTIIATLGGLTSTAAGTAIGNLISSAVTQSLSAEFSALSSVFVSSIQEASGYEDTMASLDGILISTNRTVGISKDTLLGVAGELGRTTRFSDETAISAEKVMLTFSQVGNQVFPDAIRVAGTLSMALGQDLQSSVKQVGKALSDPIQAIGELKNAGVSFTEEEQKSIQGLAEKEKATASLTEEQKKELQTLSNLEKAGGSLTDEQKEFLQTYDKSNEMMEVQNIVLDKLGGQYKEVAKTAGGTFSNQLAILKNSFGDLLQTLGSTFLPLLKDLVQWVNEKIMPAFKKWAEEHAPALRQALRDLADWLEEHVLPAVEGLVKWIVANWPGIQVTIEGTWALIKPVLEAMGDALQLIGLIAKLVTGDTEWLSDALSEAWSGIEVGAEAALDAIQGIMEGLGVAFGAVGEILGNIGAAVVSGLITAAEALGQALMVAIQGILEGLGVAFGAIGDILGDIGRDIMNGLINGAEALGQMFIDALVGIINDAINAILQLLGIASPSKVFMDIGAQMVAGLVDAITTKAAEISTAMENAISGTVSAITTRVADFFSAAAKLVLGENQDGNGGIVGGIRAIAAQIATEMGNAVSGAKDAIAAKIGEFFDAAKALIVGVDSKGETGLVGGIRSMALQIATEMGSAIRGAVTAITDMVGQFYDAAVVLVLGPKKDGEGGIVKGITDKVEDIKTAITTAIGGAADLLATLPNDIMDKLAAIGSAVVGGIKSKVTGMGDDLAKAFKSVIKSALDGIKASLGTSDNPIAQAFIDQIKAAIDLIEAALGIASPSKVFAKIGSEMVAGLAEGFATPPLSSTLAGGTMAMGLATSNAIYNQQHYYNLTIHSNAQTEQVVADFAMLRALAGA